MFDVQKFTLKVKQWLEPRKQWLFPAILALTGSMFLYGGISSYKSHLGYGMATRKVVVATKELDEGHIISKGDLALTTIPAKFTPLGVLLESDGSQAMGHAITRQVARGEMLLWSAMDTGFTPTGPARRIVKGYRALAVKVSSVTSIGQAIRPGDHVDIITTASLPGEAGATTLTLLQNVAVLDVGQPTDKNEGNYSTVSLMVLPKEVGLITFAQKNGDLTFALRNPDDHITPTDLPLVAKNELIASAFRNSLQQERNNTVEIIKGGKLTFDHAGGLSGYSQ
ncbi:MAG TPA: Flp pilus assembly protein CpaB [Bdellovibrionota bacterium]|nr:Flp pilus assembly protein CpaB [Bdellovibrionota bacterium]